MLQGNPVITRSSGPPTLPRYNRYLVINKHMIKYIKCNAWDYTLISYITTHYNHIHASVMICFVTIIKESELFKAYLGYSPKKVALQTIKIYIAVRSLWLVCMGRQVESSTVLCMWSCWWNLAVQCYDFQCRVRSPCSEIRNANLQFEKRNVCMQCVCAWTCMFMTT